MYIPNISLCSPQRCTSGGESSHSWSASWGHWLKCRMLLLPWFVSINSQFADMFWVLTQCGNWGSNVTSCCYNSSSPSDTILSHQLSNNPSSGLSRYRAIIKTCVSEASQAWCHCGGKGGYSSLYPGRIPKDKGRLFLAWPIRLGMWSRQRNGGGQCSESLLWVSKLSSCSITIFFFSRQSLCGGRAEKKSILILFPKIFCYHV